MSRYVVGDIHGCYDKLMSVLGFIQFNPDQDILYSVGDFCDRGPDSFKVLNYLLSLDDAFKSVFGNHDLWLYLHLHDMFDDHWLFNRESWETWEYNGGTATIKSLKNMSDEDLKKVLNWIRNLPYRIELDDYIIQHTTIKDCNPPIIPNEIDCTKLKLHQCVAEGYCTTDYDSWFWNRDVICSSKTIFGDKAIPCNYTRTEKPLIIGHTPLVVKDREPVPFYDKDLNIIAIDTGSFITKEKFEQDGCITCINLDSLDYYTSDRRKGSLK